MIKVYMNGYECAIETSTFPGGEEHVAILRGPVIDIIKVRIVADITSSSELMRLVLITDAARRKAKNTNVPIILEMKYLPYARQDRVCARGEAFSLKVFADIINSLNFKEVILWDCHSDVGPALIDNANNIPQLGLIKENRDLYNLVQSADFLVAPDLGAAKRVMAVADYFLPAKPVIQVTKKRVSRDLIECKVLGELPDPGKVGLVLDDICDGGGTFLAVGKALPNKLNLLVTHGIFSSGKDVLLERYDKVEALNPWS